MRPFLVCIHDATPAFAGETRLMIRDLAPRLGRRLSLAVVPDWWGDWPLVAHPGYCGLLKESSEELLLHGFFHRRRQGCGPTTWLTAGGDEMNGLDPEETRRTIERGQRVFTEVFGEPARTFLAPAWQSGHVRPLDENTPEGLEHVLGFFSLESRAGRSVPLTTWSWDCGRWAWLGHLGHGLGRVLHSLDRGVPALAIHPNDLARGFWPKILRLIDELLDAGYDPSTVAGLLEDDSSFIPASSVIPASPVIPAEAGIQSRSPGGLHDRASHRHPDTLGSRFRGNDGGRVRSNDGGSFRGDDGRSVDA